MGTFLGFSCCRKVIEVEKIVEPLAETYGLKDLEAKLEQLNSFLPSNLLD